MPDEDFDGTVTCCLSTSVDCSQRIAVELVVECFALHKCGYQDALTLCYNWQLLQAPSACACDTKFSSEHALSCSKGGFPSI